MAKITSTEEWSDAVIKHIGKLSDDEKYNFAHQIISDVALWCGYNAYETIGILRIIEHEMIQTIQEVTQEEDETND